MANLIHFQTKLLISFSYKRGRLEAKVLKILSKYKFLIFLYVYFINKKITIISIVFISIIIMVQFLF